MLQKQHSSLQSPNRALSLGLLQGSVYFHSYEELDSKNWVLLSGDKAQSGGAGEQETVPSIR